jgi:hypothetical protein
MRFIMALILLMIICGAGTKDAPDKSDPVAG